MYPRAFPSPETPSGWTRHHFRHACDERRLAAGVVPEDHGIEGLVSVAGNVQHDPSNAGVQFPVPESVPAFLKRLFAGISGIFGK